MRLVVLVVVLLAAGSHGSAQEVSSADRNDVVGRTLLDRVVDVARYGGVRVASARAECHGVITTVYEPPYDYSVPVGHFCYEPGFFNIYIAPDARASRSTTSGPPAVE